jgi:hypothetical protein
LLLVSVVALVAVAAAATAPALAGPSLFSVDGEAVCDPATGTYRITWIFTNNDENSVFIQEATLGGELSGAVTFVPQDVPGLSDAVAGTEAPGDTVGTVSVLVNLGFGAVFGEVDLDGTCTAATAVAPSTTAADTTTTVAPAVAAAPLARTPAFTG